jgi:hypothetical protein
MDNRTASKTTWLRFRMTRAPRSRSSGGRFFPMSPKVIQEHADELKSYDSSKGTIRFRMDKTSSRGPREGSSSGRGSRRTRHVALAESPEQGHC